MRGYYAAFSGRFAEAEPFYQRAVEIQEGSPKTDPEDLVRTLESYADLLRKTEREAEAVALEQRAQAIRAKDSQRTSAPPSEGRDGRPTYGSGVSDRFLGSRDHRG
jgi:Tetratricopeptide repeat